MIFNYSIFIELDNDGNSVEGTVYLTYFPKDLVDSISNSKSLINSAIAFDLGSIEYLTIKGSIDDGDYVKLDVYDNDNNHIFSNGYRLDIASSYIKIKEDISNFYEKDIDTIVEPKKTVKVIDVLNIVDIEVDGYSWFGLYVINEEDNTETLIDQSNNKDFEFIPPYTGKYKILQRIINNTKDEEIEKEFLVSSTGDDIEVEEFNIAIFIQPKRMLKLELSDVIIQSLALTPNFRIEGNTLIGKLDNMSTVRLPHSKGYIIVKAQVGAIFK